MTEVKPILTVTITGRKTKKGQKITNPNDNKLTGSSVWGALSNAVTADGKKAFTEAEIARITKIHERNNKGYKATRCRNGASIDLSDAIRKAGYADRFLRSASARPIIDEGGNLVGVSDTAGETTVRNVTERPIVSDGKAVGSTKKSSVKEETPTERSATERPVVVNGELTGVSDAPTTKKTTKATKATKATKTEKAPKKETPQTPAAPTAQPTELNSKDIDGIGDGAKALLKAGHASEADVADFIDYKTVNGQKVKRTQAEKAIAIGEVLMNVKTGNDAAVEAAIGKIKDKAMFKLVNTYIDDNTWWGKDVDYFVRKRVSDAGTKVSLLTQVSYLASPDFDPRDVQVDNDTVIEYCPENAAYRPPIPRFR